jgi:Cytochrome c554 and c-prime
MRWMLLVLALGVEGSACSDAPASAELTPHNGASQLSREQLLDPETCKGCHPQHYREWASSMHAYAAEDPVFAAMNRRGQRETGGELGDFCVRCHAPMAVREGATHDGLNLVELPRRLKGVTCYFCHNTVDVAEPFNNQLGLANDTLLRGAIADPVPNGAHSSAYSRFHDRDRAESSRLCGGCHDVVTPRGVHLERTFDEYQQSLYGHQSAGFETCSGCHMPGRPGTAAVGVGRQRSRHEHLWPGVDTALTVFPDREAQRRAVECELSQGAIIYEIAQDELGGLSVRLETLAGHAQPSGSSIHRRMWLELTAYDDKGQVLFESGRIRDGELEQKPVQARGFDAQLALFRDWAYDADGREVHMFWNAAPSTEYPLGYASLTLPAQLTARTAHTLDATYQIPSFGRVERIDLRLRMRALGMDVLADLVASGDLDATALDEQPTFTQHGAAVEYRPKTRTTTPLWPEELICPDSYRCLLDPEGC